MPKQPQTIESLFHVPERFVRSVQLERDFLDPAALDDYIATPAVAEAFVRIAEALRPNAGRRAWRITGDYGVGKSSFALVVAQILAGGQSNGLRRLAGGLGWDTQADKVPEFWPILLTGSRNSLVTCVAKAIGEAIALRRPSKGKTTQTFTALIEQAALVAEEGDLVGLENLLTGTRALAAEQGKGVLLVIDELGKFLEFAAQSDGSEDVFVLQRLAETAARSGKQPFLLLTLLHQGFHAYAEKLPMASRNEWEKVGGRFEEIVFDQPLAHMAALVAGALRIDTEKLAMPLHAAAAKIATATADMGWLGGGTVGAAGLDVARLYPIHPTVLPVLVRFFARFGQHERSLFGFLLSNEPFGLQHFADRDASPECWYRLDDLYDYVRACFGHRLAGVSYRSHWLRIVATIDSAEATTELELSLLKAIAVLNLIDADDLLPTERALAACFSQADHGSVSETLAELCSRGAIFRRGAAAGYRLWPNASVNLEVALESAARAVGEIRDISASLIPYLSAEPIMARRHYLETGTLRYFEIRYCTASDILECSQKESRADGILIVALADDLSASRYAMAAAQSFDIVGRSDIILCIANQVSTLAGELQDLVLWNWVSQNTPELAEDAYATSEVSRQVSSARRNLLARAEQLMGLRHNNNSACIWKGKAVEQHLHGRGISATLSFICDDLYKQAPRITNELLNRNVLSSAASAARMRLIERIFTSAEEDILGLDPDKAPPEKSIYLSILKAGNVHVETANGFAIKLPEKEQDRLGLGNPLKRLHELIKQAGGDKVSVANLFEDLRRPPYGVRDGVIPLLLAILLRTSAHEMAVYEHGTFLHRFGSSDFQRLIKGPHYFEIQHCQISGVRLEVFEALVRSFADEPAGKVIDLLDVVRPLCTFAAQLPDYTKKSSGLSATAIAVRDALLEAREPLNLLFTALPAACELHSFAPERSNGPKSAKQFAERLQDAVDELRHAYDALLVRIQHRTAEALGPTKYFDRVAIAGRAANVSLVAREPRLRTFALRLRDPGLTDTAWAEALASYVVAKPPSKWLAADEARFIEEAGALSEHFCKTEAAAFNHPELRAQPDAVRLNMTRGDGEDLVCIIEGTPDDDIAGQAKLLSGRLPRDAALRRRVLAELLWQELKSETGTATLAEDSPDDAKSVA